MFLKIMWNYPFGKKRDFKKTLLIMKLTAILLFAACMQVSATGFSQKITLSQNNVSLKKVFKEIENQSGYQFFYRDKLLRQAGDVSIHVTNASIEEALNECFKNQPLTYSILDKIIVVKAKPTEPVAMQALAVLPAVPLNIISGTVKDEKGNPLAGVSVVLKGTNKGTSTDVNGHFTIDANVGEILEFTIVGYSKKSVRVGSNNNLNVQLEVEAMTGNDIVVVGYGTQKKADLTGAISTVNVGKILGDRPVGTMSTLLQNEVPGLSISIPSGQPGSSTSWNIRGATDINTTGNSINTGGPLILVDNVPFNGPLDLINPNDIATVTVLKDAGAAAIYGGRSAFGVILITTKQGKKNQKPQFSYSNNITFASATNLPVKANGDQFLQSLMDMGTTSFWSGQNVAHWKNLYDSLKNNTSGIPNGVVYVGSVGYPVIQTDAIRDLLGSSVPQIQNNFSVNGGSDKTTYRLSFGQTGEKGIMDPAADLDYFKRYNVSSSLSSDVNKWLTTQVDANYYNFLTSTPSNMGENYYLAATYPSLMPLSDSIAGTNGIKGINGTPKNVTSMSGANVSKNSDVRLTGRGILKPLKGLTITGEYTYDNLQNIQQDYNTLISVIAPADFQTHNYGSGNYELINQSTIYESLNVFANYEKSFGYNNLTFLAGYNQEENVTSGNYVYRNSMIAPNQPSLSNATGPLSAGDNYSAYALRGYFGRINYNYKGKYLAQINGRYDGSSNFPPGHRYGFFPSGSVGWRISNEKFMSSLQPVLSDLKIRASYGSVGNQTIPTYSYIPTLSNVQPGWLNSTSSYLTSLSSPGLISSGFTWEKVETLDYGVDFGLFSEKLTGSFDWYRRDTKDILAPGATPLPAVLGTGAPLENTASLRSTGYEMALTYRDQISRNIRFSISANLSDNTAKVTRFDGNPTKVLSSYYVGQQVGEIWGYKTAGLYTVNDFEEGTLSPQLTGGTLLPKMAKFQGENPNPGDVMYQDYNGDGIVYQGLDTRDSSGDMRIIGNSTPRYIFGVNGSISYENFTFSFVMSGVGKQDLAMANPLIFPNYNQFATVYANELNYWTPTHTNSYFGRIYDQAAGNQSFNEITQTRFLQNGAYLRINNLTLDYALPVSLLKKVDINSFHIFCSLENPFLFDHLPKGLEPGLTNQGTGLEYPYLKKTSFGVNLTF